MGIVIMIYLFALLMVWPLHAWIAENRNDLAYDHAMLAQNSSDPFWIHATNQGWLDLHNISIVAWVDAIVVGLGVVAALVVVGMAVYDMCQDMVSEKRMARKA